jgi:hypothetical protein
LPEWWTSEACSHSFRGSEWGSKNPFD